MSFARWAYRIAGIYGLLCLAPFLFLEEKIGRDYPPAITHAEHYYGFVGVGLAWQVAFLIIASDPIRYRPLMIATLVEKGIFGIATIVLFAQQRIPGLVLGFGITDLVLGTLFLISYLRTPAPAARA
jgi:hypothetical protein